MSNSHKFPRIIFLGTPDFAVASLKSLVENQLNVVAVVTAPDKPAGRGMKMGSSPVKEYAITQHIPVLQPEKLRSKMFLKQLQSFHANLQVVVAFRMLPEVVWDMPPLGTINVHASLLPQYRGAAPINRAIMNGETESGVTTFKLKHEIDTGNILLQKSVPVLEEDNFGSLYEKLMNAGADILLQTIRGIIENKIVEKSQTAIGTVYAAPKIFKDDCKIDWHQTSEKIHNLIRGLSPYPTAFTFLQDKQIKIFESSISKESTNHPSGMYETDGKTFLRFAAQDGWVYLLDVQYEGKKRMKVADFLRGFRNLNPKN